MAHNTVPRPTKRERRDAHRAARLEAERREAERAARRRRIGILGAAVLLIAAAIAVVAVVTRPDAEQPAAAAGAPPQGAAEVTSLLRGIRQEGVALGDPDAPVTLVEFADMQCPFCADFARETLPSLVRDYVRGGKVRIEFRPLAFIGPDSQKTAELLAAAAAQDRLWHLMDLVYRNQGAENAGWATDDLLRGLMSAVPGLDAGRALADAGGEDAAQLLAAAQADATRHAIESTPALLVGRTGGDALRAVPDALDYRALQMHVEAALAR